MTTDELKCRQMTNQYLITHADKFTVVRDLCGVQAQFLANAVHSLRIRCADFDEATVGDGLVKNWSVRGTVHVFAEEDLALFKHCHNGTSYRSDEFPGFRGWMTPERQKFFSHLILDALAEGDKTRDELKEICRAAGITQREEDCIFDPWGGGIRTLCERGFVHYVVQEKKAYTLSPPFTPIPEEEANLEIARRYFTNIAPATIHDAMYYFGATAAQVKDWLAKLPVTSCECEGKTYYYIENGKSYDREMPACIFLAGFDQLMLGYQKRESLYLPQEHLRGIFNLAGIVMPAVLLRGRVVGKWRKKNRKLEIVGFEKLNAADKKLISTSAEELWNSELGAICFAEK